MALAQYQPTISWLAAPRRGWKLALAFFILLGQIAVLYHVISHQLEQDVAQDDDHCSFCSIGSHAKMADVPTPLPTFVWTKFYYVVQKFYGAEGYFLPRIQICGPPTLPIV